jgi:hypothetical protein
MIKIKIKIKIYELKKNNYQLQVLYIQKFFMCFQYTIYLSNLTWILFYPRFKLQVDQLKNLLSKL